VTLPIHALGQLPFSVQERDIDILILKELACSPDFFARIAAEAGFESASFMSAKHSVYRDNGETDVLVFLKAGGKTVALMIEDKIGAGMQPKQAERYRKRGALLVERGEAQIVKTMLMAPAAYLKDVPQSDWDVLLEFETVASWFDCNEDPRLIWQRKLLLDAAARIERAYRVAALTKKTPEQIKAIIAFKAAYAGAMKRDYPDYKISLSNKLEPSYVFAPQEAPTYVRYWHLIAKGELNLTFENKWRERALQILVDHVDTERLVAHPTAIHVTSSVEAMDMTQPFEEQYDTFRAVMAIAEAIRRLVTLVVEAPP
jgi:hypothetical protein